MAFSSGDPEESFHYRHRRFADFLEAAFTGDLKKVKKMAKELDRKGDGLAKTIAEVQGADGLNAFHFAAQGGRTQLCKYFISEVKLDVNIKDAKDETPLHHAIIEGHYSAADYLLANGANPNAASKQGHTALHYAAERGLKKLLLLLISKGAEVDAIADWGTPLHKAAYSGNHEALKVLLDNHAHPNMILQHVNSPLCLSVIAQSFESVKLLVKAGADPNLISCGMTPLRVAAIKGETQIMKYLLDVGADPNVYNGELTPLELSALRHNYEAVKILFPVTSPIERIPEWSLNGIIRHLNSDPVQQERMLKEDEFLMFLKKGTDAFQRNEYYEAIHMYTEALNIKPSANVYCSRSLCWSYLNGGGKSALSDAKACIKLSPKMSLAYCREGVAYTLLQDPVKAADSFARALMLEPENKRYQHLYWEAIEAEFNFLFTLRDLENFCLKPRRSHAE